MSVRASSSPGPSGAGSRSLIDVVHAVRAHLRARAGTILGAGAAGVIGALLTLAWLLAGSEGWRPGTPVPLLLVVLAVVALAALTGWVLVRLRRWASEPSLAGEMERSARLPEGSVRAQVELARAIPPGVSPSLARAGEASLLSRLPDDPARLGGRPAKELQRLGRLSVSGGTVLAVVAVTLLLLAPARARSAWAGLARPFTLLAPEPLPPLEVSPGNAQVPRGEAPGVQVRAEGRDSVTVHWQAVGDVPQDRRIAVEAGRGETRLPALEVEVRYWASSADGARTPVYSFFPSDPSLLSNLLIEATYPGYTRIPPETFRVAPTELSVPEGTEFALSGSIEGTGSNVLLQEAGGDVAARLGVEDGRFAGRWRPRRTARIEWVLEGGQEGGQLPPSLALEVVPDEAPALALPVPGGDGDLPLSLRVPLLVDASDDYGVSWVEVETELHRGNDVQEPVVDRIPTGDLPRVMLRPVLDFSGWALLPGDQILLKARASDNAPVGHVVETVSYRLTMPGPGAVRDSARARIQETAAKSQDLLDEIKEQTASIRDLERRNQFGASRSRGSSDDTDAYQDREELLQALDRQADLAEELDQLRSGLKEAGQALSEMARENPADAELRERIAQLEQLLEDVLGPEARERLDELVQDLTAGTMPDDPSNLLDEMAARQEGMQSQLEQALNQLRDSAIQEAFRGVEDEIQDLVSTQEDLVQELAQGQGEERQLEQAEHTGDLQERLENLRQELSDSGDPSAGDLNDPDPNAGDQNRAAPNGGDPNDGDRDAAERTASAQQNLSDAKDAMNDAADASQSGDRQEASQNAADAQSSLENALQQLQDTRSQMAQNAEDSRRDALRQSAQDALSLSRRQSELRESIRRSRPGTLRQFENEEAAILEGMRNLQRQVGDAANQAPDVEDLLTQEMRRSLDAAEQTVEGLRGTSGPQPDPGVFADSAQAALNRLALGALQHVAGSQASQPGDQTEGGSQQQLGSLGAQQQELNDQAQQLSKQSTPNGVPSQMDMQDLVAGQQGVATVLRDMARLPGPGQPQSTLDALADESQQIAEELRQGRLDATTLARQDQFLQRLLSAGRTLERDGPTDVREATAAEPTPRRAVTALPEELLDPRAFPLPSADELGQLTPGQRALVLEYFDRVNRRRASGDAQ